MRDINTSFRSLKSSWLCEALRLTSSDVDIDTAVKQLESVLMNDISGAESIRKTIRFLRHTWLVPTAAFRPLRDEALKLYRQRPTDECARTLSFFILMVKYPFMREVAEVCGRLLRLQGNVKAEQIKRRISEAYGVRETVSRSTERVLSTLVELNVLVADVQKGIYGAGKLPVYPDVRFAAFCLSALFTSLSAEHGVRRRDLVGHPALFAFDAHLLVDCALTDPRFIISRESITEDMISLKIANH